MEFISASDEFKLLESTQACGVDPSNWLKTLGLIERLFCCKAYLLEFSSCGSHTGRYCNRSDADELISYLSSLQAEAGRSAHKFLLDDASIHYPYCKNWLACQHAPSPTSAPETHLLADWPGLITPLKRNSEHIVLFACLFTSLGIDEIDQEVILPTFQRLARAASASIEVSEKVER